MQRYGPMIVSALENIDKANRSSIEADTVAKVIGRAMTVRRPRGRYRVGRDALLASALSKLLPDWAMDRLILRLMKEPPNGD